MSSSLGGCPAVWVGLIFPRNHIQLLHFQQHCRKRGIVAFLVTSICPTVGDMTLDHLDEAVCAELLHCKVPLCSLTVAFETSFCYQIRAKFRLREISPQINFYLACMTAGKGLLMWERVIFCAHMFLLFIFLFFILCFGS